MLRAWAAGVLSLCPTSWILGQEPPAVDPIAAAHEQLEQGKSAEAIAALLALVSNADDKHQPLPKGAIRELGLAYYRSGKLVDAERTFARALAQDPEDQESVQMRGLTLYRLGQPSAAIPFLERVRQWMPDANADANYALGLCYLNSRQYDRARQTFAIQYGLEPESAEAYLVHARMLIRANLPEMGAEAAKKAIALKPGLALAHFVLGEVLLFKSDADGALIEFLRERELNPSYPPVYDRLADVYLRTERFREAQECLTRSIALDTSSTGPFILMGKLLLRRKDPQTASMYLRRAAQMDPGSYTSHNFLGQAYRMLGRDEEAKHEFEAAAKIHVANQPKFESVQ